jgi:CheY-like chemotaxis protein
MKILVVEDDHFQAEQILDALGVAFPDAICKQLDSEHSFYRLVDTIEDDLPDIILMDVMLRWTHPDVEMPIAPDEVLRDKHYRAGFRCQRLLAEREATRKIKMILYTVLERSDIDKEVRALPPNVTYMRKEANYEPFVRMVRRLISYR